MPWLGCELIWDEQTAASIRSFIEESTGEPCPCAQGKPCPLLPGLPLREPETLRDPGERLSG